MPQLTVARLGGSGQREAVGPGWDCRWMEEAKEDREGGSAERREQSRSDLSAALRTSWSRLLRRLPPWRRWRCFALVALVWSVSQAQAEASPQPAPSQVDVCWRLLLLCLLWTLLGGCVCALRFCLQPGPDPGRPLVRTEEEVMTESRENQCSSVSPAWVPGQDVPVALALADSLLLCVLQEPPSAPTGPHITSLLSRLQSVSQTLEKADIWSGGGSGHVELTDKVKLICTYLQERMESLRRLVQVQGDFEASVQELLQGLEGLWAQLEELHTGVTLTKEGRLRDLASARTEAETLFAVLGRYRNRLQRCQAHLKDSTLLLQELTWSHSHLSSSVSSNGSESVWPELLLQANIEQFDKVQESFFTLEQQTSTFQAHLQGLERESQEGHAGPLAQVNGAPSGSGSPQIHQGRSGDVSPEHRNSVSGSSSVSSTDVTDLETKTETLSLCERSALHFSSTIGRLRKSGRRK